jgi:hypothetical protein
VIAFDGDAWMIFRDAETLSALWGFGNAGVSVIRERLYFVCTDVHA